jgi:hypothetical protein
VEGCCTEPGPGDALYILCMHPWTVSNTDSVGVLFKCLMHILNGCGLMLTIDTKDGPDLSSDRAQLSGGKSRGERRFDRGSQMGARHRDGLADSLSVVAWLWLWLDRLCGLAIRVPRYQIFWEVVVLERGPPSLVSTIEEGSGLENRDYGRRGSAALTTWHPSIRCSWH